MRELLGVFKHMNSPVTHIYGSDLENTCVEKMKVYMSV